MNSIIAPSDHGVAKLKYVKKINTLYDDIYTIEMETSNSNYSYTLHNFFSPFTKILERLTKVI